MVPHTEKDKSLKALFQSSSTDLEMPVYSKIDERISIAAFSCPKIINYCFVLCEKNDLKSFRKCNIAWHTFATDKLFWVDIVLVTLGNLTDLVQECNQVIGFCFTETKIPENTPWNIHAILSPTWSRMQYWTTLKLPLFCMAISIF